VREELLGRATFREAQHIGGFATNQRNVKRDGTPGGSLSELSGAYHDEEEAHEGIGYSSEH